MSSKETIRRTLAVLGLSFFMVLTGCAQGSGGNAVDVEAVVNGFAVSESSPGDPIKLGSDQATELELTMRNVSDTPQTVRYVRFEGQVIDMIFLTYDTAVSVELEPGESRNLPPILLDFYDLGGQAGGYLRGHVQLYDADREVLGSQQAFLNASGSGFSTLALFNVLLLLGTIAGAAWNLMRLSQRRLPPNRFTRGLRFLAVGAGAGLTLAVAFSTLRIWPLDTLAWLFFAIVGAVIGYVVGFMLPGADDHVVDILDEQDVLDAVVDAEAAV